MDQARRREGKVADNAGFARVDIERIGVARRDAPGIGIGEPVDRALRQRHVALEQADAAGENFFRGHDDVARGGGIEIECRGIERREIERGRAEQRRPRRFAFERAPAAFHDLVAYAPRHFLRRHPAKPIEIPVNRHGNQCPPMGEGRRGPGRRLSGGGAARLRRGVNGGIGSDA